MLKKIMIGSGAFSVVAFLVGSFFKVMHWPGASVLLTLAIGLISFLFLPLVFILKAREVNTGLEKLTVAIGTMLAILFCMDILFTVQHWPGATILWFSTVFVSLFIFIPLYFFTGIRKPETRTNTILTTIMLVGFTGLLFTAINLRPTPHQYENGLNSYLQNEEIWKSIEKSPAYHSASNDAAVSELLRISAQMKSSILEYATGKTSLPANTSASKIDFRQESLAYMNGYFKPEGAGVKLFQQLQQAAKDYSKTNAAKPIPAALAIIDDEPEHIIAYDNMYLLNSLTQLQIYLVASNGAEPTVAQQ